MSKLFFYILFLFLLSYPIYAEESPYLLSVELSKSQYNQDDFVEANITVTNLMSTPINGVNMTYALISPSGVIDPYASEILSFPEGNFTFKRGMVLPANAEGGRWVYAASIQYGKYNTSEIRFGFNIADKNIIGKNIKIPFEIIFVVIFVVAAYLFTIND